MQQLEVGLRAIAGVLELLGRLRLRVLQVTEVMRLLDAGLLAAAGTLGRLGCLPLRRVPAAGNCQVGAVAHGERLGWRCVGEVVAAATDGVGEGYWWRVDEVAAANATDGAHGEGEFWRGVDEAAAGAHGKGQAAAAAWTPSAAVVSM